MSQAPWSQGAPKEIGGYRLVGVLGEGGQGSVYLGEAADGRRVAVKVLHGRFDGDGKALERFVREVEAARRVAQFCTARVLEVATAGGIPYIVSEYVPGESLRDLVARDGPRDAGAVERLAVGTASALSAIHQAGIMHRDFKPHNVLMGPDGPRVIDFGIARALDTVATDASGVIGTPAYMSPEQITGGRIGFPTDLFSWALTMVYAATGRHAFGDDTMHVMMWRIVNDEPDLSGIPERLEVLISAALAKDPSRRPTATEVLLSLLGHQPPGKATLVEGETSAEYELRAALEGRLRVLGPDHPDTLASRQEVGRLLWGLGRLAEAEVELRATLEGRLRTLDADDPETLWAHHNLGGLLVRLRQFPEAERQLRTALEGRLRVLGPAHPHTLWIRTDLGVLFKEQGRFEDAKTQLYTALEGRLRVLGPDHPETLASRQEVGRLLWDLGRLAEAETELRATLEGRLRVLDADDPETLWAHHNLGGLLARRGRMPEAEALLRTALEGRLRILGPDHPETLWIRNDLGVLLKKRGR
ncbi:serine/threonine-protein kinase [Actinomadura decatromicini]|uniref:Serine/threonine protein kinase n=1 Tax=Actinomadura decatromicini TaxID=2604572 RepID=A0A5D3FRB2_9ACTN|nr:serine/threonine-protein kinase [Actinomadura decatromicini]TYK50592.1 serine/threonine protein kinase [Actinomadura decatromicini]